MQNGNWGQTGLFAALQNCPVCVGSCQTSFSTLSWRGHCAEVLGDSVLCRSDPFLFLGPELMARGLVRVSVGSCLFRTPGGKDSFSSLVQSLSTLWGGLTCIPCPCRSGTHCTATFPDPATYMDESQCGLPAQVAPCPYHC